MRWQEQLGIVEKEENNRKTHHHCLLHANCEWGMVVVGSYSPCGLSIRRDRNSSNQNTVIVKLWWWLENETRAFTHTWQLNILDTICVVMEQVLIYSYIFWCHILNLNA